MASPFSHAVAALSIGTCIYRPKMPKRVWIAGALCSVLPDIDVIGFHFGIHYGDFWGHPGLTHSLLFAAILATFVAILGSWRASPSSGFLWIWRYLLLASASHGLLSSVIFDFVLVYSHFERAHLAGTICVALVRSRN